MHVEPLPQVTLVEPLCAVTVAVAPSATVTEHASTELQLTSHVAPAAQVQSAAQVKVPLVAAVGTVGTIDALQEATKRQARAESRRFFISEG